MVLDTFRLGGRVALVTGGNRGIGRAIATALAQAGADIALLGRTEPADTVTAVERLGRRVLVVPADLSTAGPAALADAVEAVVAGLGRLDVLVNNAGIIRRAAALEHPPEDWDAVLRVDLDAVFQLCQAAGRVMLGQGYGKIVNVASMLSYQGGIRVPSYTAAKHAVVGLTRALANEWAAGGVNVNAIAPGYIATDNTAPLRADPDRERAIRERIPAGRWGAPEDLAGAVVFLASDAARYVHGAVLPVDGGWLAR
ncbi:MULTISPECIES: 2-dehydro-3-deoxy-D-gluconate 5-dehydrogenase KduD [unclassified Plantactinospora]|uniref:2-dehydro-3-deoxy-D-gluconate 5-dehydrogenase KduD n=1 Tax=unclassified Plantactinospora TaxID=2631981 RepID=UPI000D167AD1|nr:MULTISPECIES: 2-dehydro-3-deoxy-D-gluconate 5-dehydrogenase KduD [unclassified Plantactinospora]AVT29164.1 2-deoxy-D-gluconate 3-dehydrogenase [Plantactinospora sp. BC1]AVT35569.1 2-deoxy-D-gluconate 3-dehydrogenase [Plantactinospora sp. BB1]